MRIGIHFIRTQFGDDLLPDEWNKQLRGAVQPGVKEGYAARQGSTAAKVDLEPGILVTGEGDSVELESEYSDVPGLDATANAALSDRLDLIYCYYRYVESSPPPQPSYGVKLGTAGSPSLTAFGQNQYQIPVALALVATGASVYSKFYPFPRMYRVNHYVLSGKEYVTNGNQTAMRILIIPMTIPSLSINAGIRIEMVEAGTYSDDDEILAWSAPWHLEHDGEAGFNALLAEVVAARGSMPALDDRLDVSLNENGTLNFSGALGALLAEVVAARGDKTSLDTRMDVSLNENGTLKVNTVKGHSPAALPPSMQVMAKTINYDDIANSGIREENLADECVTVNKIGIGAVGTNRLADWAVSHGKLGLLSVKEANIWPGAVTTGKIDDLAVATGKLADAAVTQAKRAAKLYGRWKNNAVQSIASGGTGVYLEFATQEVANLGGFATKSNLPFVFTATRDMKLHISVFVMFDNAAWVAGNQARLAIVRVRGAATYYIRLDTDEVDYDRVRPISLSGSVLLDLNAGDYIRVRAYHDRGSGTNIDYDAAENIGWVSIEEV